MTKEKMDEFIDGLNALSVKTGVKLTSCGCCGGIYVDDRGNDKSVLYVAEEKAKPDDNGEYSSVNICW